MSFIDQIEPRSRNHSISSRYTSRNNTFVKPGTGGKISINPSKLRRSTLGSHNFSKIRGNTIADSMAVKTKPKYQQDIEESLVDDHHIVDDDIELLEHKNKSSTMLLLMLMGMASFTRGYYMMVYNPMGLYWFRDDYKFKEGVQIDSWLGLYNFVWMFGAFFGTKLGAYLYDRLGPRVCLFIYQGLRIPVTFIYQIPNFEAHVANRAACGILVGCLIYTVPKYIKQIAPDSLCSYALQFANCMAVFGGITVAILGLTMGALEMADQWRIMLTAPGIIPFIQIPFFIYWNIDSPSWMLDRYASKTSTTNKNSNEYKVVDVEKVAPQQDVGRRLDEDATFEEKYGYTIDQKHLDKICKDFNKVYKPESADLAYEDLLQIHKEKLNHPQPDFKTFIKDSYNKYIFFVCICQNLLTRFTGMNHFQFYIWYQFTLSGMFGMEDKDSDEKFGSWALFAICMSALVSLLVFYFIADKINRKITMMVGVLIQCICLTVISVVHEDKDVLRAIYIPILVLYTFGFSFGMEGSGILFTNEALPPCAVPHAMYIQWLAGCVICFSNQYAFKVGVVGLMVTFAICSGISFMFIGFMSRETRNITLGEQRVSYGKIHFFK